MENTETPVTETEQKSEEKSFTQEDVNNIVAKESKKAVEKLLKDLGVEDVKSAKDGLKTFKEMQEAQKSDLEKALEKAEMLEKELSDYKIKEKQNNEIESIKAILTSKSINENYAKTIYKLIGEADKIDETLVMNTIQEELPMLLEQEQIKIGMQKNEDKPTSAVKDYLDKKYKDNPFYNR